MIALLLAAVAPAALVGVYDGGQMEIAAGLELRADGRFRYGLAYGALDEEAEGVWTVEGNRVLLTTEPAVIPPRFVLADQQPAAPGTLAVTIVDPKGRALPNIDIAVTYDMGDPEIVQSRDEAVVLPVEPARPPRAILLAVPVFDVASDSIPIDAAKGYGFTFRFEPNGLGKADFKQAALEVEDGALVMPRFDRTLRFRKR